MILRRHRRLTIASSVIGAMVVALDGTVLTVAQPTLQRDLHASFVQVQWTSTGYLIAVASLLVFAGRLGDRYGHRQVFAIGSLGFAATSAGIGLAPGIGWVIGLRVVQGIFGALLQPATLGMLRAAFPRDRLGMPIALRTSAIGMAAAAGPVIGGALAVRLGWRAVFFINVVPALAIAVTALAVRVAKPRSRGASGAGLDLPGACLLAVALVCLVHTLVGIPETGWTGAAALGFAVAAAAGATFIRHERRTTSPLVPSTVFGSAAVVSALGILALASASLFGALFISTYFLQDVLGLNPLQSGLRVLPLAVMMVLGAPVSAVLLRRGGARRTTVAAMALLALGILLLSGLGQDSPPAQISGCFLLLGAGFGTVMVSATAVIVRHAPVDDAGVAGGLQQTAMNIGPTLGIAMAATLMTLTTPGSGAGRPDGEGPGWTAAAFDSAMSPTLVVLAAVAVIGALPAIRLPGHAGSGPAGNPAAGRPPHRDLDPSPGAEASAP